MKGSCFVWKGKYYIIATPSVSDKSSGKKVLEMTQKAISQLEDSGKPVWGLTILPKDGLIKDSVQYFKTDAMGLGFMKETYIALYQKGNKEIKIFISRRQSAKSAEIALSRYIEYVKKYGEGVKPLTENNIKLFLCEMGGFF